MTEREDLAVNLVASGLTNSAGTTIIGHVAQKAAVITIDYPNGETVKVVADDNGDFLNQSPAGITEGTVKVVAVDPKHKDFREVVVIELELPAPVVTGIISTHDDQRRLEGYVNQADVIVTVNFAGELIDAEIDDQQAFEVALPDYATPELVTLRCENTKTGKVGHNKVSLGVTSKTQAVPILTPEMIEAYQSETADEEEKVVKPVAPVVSAPVKKRGPLRRFFGWLFGRKKKDKK